MATSSFSSGSRIELERGHTAVRTDSTDYGLTDSYTYSALAQRDVWVKAIPQPSRKHKDKIDQRTCSTALCLLLMPIKLGLDAGR
jgi:hypothetical protein